MNVETGEFHPFQVTVQRKRKQRIDEMAEEWEEENAPPEALTEADRKAIQQEIDDLEGFQKLAVSITHNAKGQALLTALRTAFGKAEELGAAQKAIIFTESRRTQEYLLRVLANSPWKDHIVLFNGSNNDPRSKEIYQEWLQNHQGTDRITGSRSADLRSALVDYFKDEGKTAETMTADGYVKTGDAGFFDEKTGHLKIIDRA